MWYGLASGCSSLSTGLFFQLPNVRPKSKFLFNQCNIYPARSSYDNCFFSGVTLCRSYFCNEHLGFKVYAVWHSQLIVMKYFCLSQLNDKLKLFFNISFIGAVYTLWLHPFPLMLLSDKHKSLFILEYVLYPSINPYLLVPFKSYTWKFHIKLSIASKSGKTTCTLIV